jgi:hypothetical protein
MPDMPRTAGVGPGDRGEDVLGALHATSVVMVTHPTVFRFWDTPKCYSAKRPEIGVCEREEVGPSEIW